MKHGQNSTYHNHGCRCVPCVEAARAYRKQYKATILARLAARPDSSTLRHGTRSKYNIESCRCEDCTKAERDYSRLKKREYAATAKARKLPKKKSA